MHNFSTDCVIASGHSLPQFVARRVARFESDTIRADRSAHAIVLGSTPKADHLDLRSNDYLAVGRHPYVLEAQIRELERSGNNQMMSAVFLTSGNPQMELENRFANFVRAEATVMFQSGYQANTGLMQTIAEAGTPVYLDQMAHASLYQGVLAACADLRPFRHNDIDHLQRQIAASGPGVIAIDSVYSTDGSLAPIQSVLAVAERMGCVLVVDESHSLGTHGPRGSGLVVEMGLENRVHFRTASLAKAFCGRAGLVACASEFAHYLRFSSFPSIFSSAILPHELAAFAQTLELVQCDEWRRTKLHGNAKRLRFELDALGYNVSASGSQIIALEAGTESKIVTLAKSLQAHGVYGAPFFAPATAKNRACIRLSVHAGLDDNDIRRIVGVCTDIRDQVDYASWSSTRRKHRVLYRSASGRVHGRSLGGKADSSLSRGLAA